MAQAINAPLNVQFQNNRQLTQQIQASINAVRFNFGGGSRSLNSLSQPLGRLTGQADEFTKSLDAANARVLAFGASVGIVNAFSNAFKSLVASTIEVEKAIKAITVVGDQFNGKTKQLSQGLFNVAKVTGQSFAEVSKAALEFSRQGLNVEQTLQRTQDALILTRLTGLDAAKSVEGLTAAVNGFTKAGLTTTQVLNKLAAVDQAFAVSSADLIEGFNRSAAVAENAGVTFDELAGIITSLQQQTSRGGAVIGNALKTIFTRLQDTSTLNQLQGLGIAVQDLEGNLLPARQILQNLAKDVEGLGQITRAGIFKDVAGTFQINQLIALVSDLGKKNSIAARATEQAAGATNEAFVANQKLNQSLDAILNKVAVTGKQLGSLIGEIGLSDSFKSILDSINGFLEGAANLLQGDDLGGRFAKGIIKGIGAVLTGPGLGIFLAVIAKLTLDLVKFGTQSVKTFFGIGKAAREQQLIQEAIAQTLLREQGILNRILSVQGGQNAQAQEFLSILNQQEQALQNIRTLAGGIAAPLIGAGYGIGPQGNVQRRGRAAGGYLPAQEASDVRRGVGGASPNSKVVAIPNFAFGGGKRGTMIANTSEYIVPNYAGGGSAIFNQDMVKTMGLPPGAKKIGAAGGFVPNFEAANFNVSSGRKRKDKNTQVVDAIKISGMSPSAYVTLGSGAKTQTGNFRDLQTTAQEILQQKLGAINPSAKIIGSGIEFVNINRLNSSYLSGGQLVKDIEDLRSGKKGINIREVANKILPQTPGRLDDGLRQQIESEIKSPKAAKFSAGNIFEDVLIKTLTGKLNTRNSKTWDLPKSISEPFKKQFQIKSAFGDIKLGISPSSVSSFIGKHIIDPTGTNASNGYIPNFAASNFTNDQLAVLGLYGNTGGNINGSPIYTLSSQRPEVSRDIAFEYTARVKKMVRDYSKDIASKIPGLKLSPKSIQKSVQSADNVSGFIFEDVANQLAGPNFDSNRISGGSRADFPLTSNLRSLFDVTGAQRYAELKLDPYSTSSIKSVKEKQKALAAGAALPRELTDAELKSIPQLRADYLAYKNLPGRSKDPNEYRRIVAALGLDPTTQKDTLNTQIERALGLKSSPNRREIGGVARMRSADGFVPNFAGSFFGKGKTIAEVLNQVFLDGLLDVNEAAAILDYAKIAGPAVAGKLKDAIRAKLMGGKKIQPAAQVKLAQAGFLPPVPPRNLSRAAAEGFMPNFAASALQEAIAREKSAGLSSSQIYVDQSSALKSPSNPMGLMVANTRDEPAGGFQGIARARKEGANPKLYGAAGGFVPNFTLPIPPRLTPSTAPNQTQPQNNPQTEPVAKGFADLAGKLIVAQSAMTFLSTASSEVGGKFEQFATSLTQTIGSLVQFGFLLQGTKLGDAISKGLKGFGGKIAGSGLGQKVSSLGRGIGGLATRGAARIGLGGLAGGGVAAGAAVAVGAAYLARGAISGIKEAFRKDLSGTFESFADSASKATSQLDAVGKETAKFATTQADTLGFIERFGLQVSRFFLQDATKIKVGEDVTKITSTNNSATSEQLEQLRNSLIQANVAAGATPEEAIKNTVGFLKTLDKRPEYKEVTNVNRAGNVSTRRIKRGEGIELDLTDPEAVQKTVTQYERLGIAAAEVAKRNDFARAQELAKERTESATKTLNLNAQTVKALQDQYAKLRDTILKVDIDAAFQKFTNKTLVDLNTGLSAGQRSVEEFNNSIKEIEIDFEVEKAKNLSSELEKVNLDIQKALEGVGVKLDKPEQLGAIKQLQEAVVGGDLNALADATKALAGLNGIDLNPLRETTLQFQRQNQELERQTKLKISQARLDFAAKTLADQQTLAIQKQTSAIEKQVRTLEKSFDLSRELIDVRREIEDTKFERSLIGLSDRARTSREISRQPELRQREQEDVIADFRKTMAGEVNAIISELPDTLSFATKQALRQQAFAAQEGILTTKFTGSPQEQVGQIQSKTEQALNKLIEEISKAEKASSDAAFAEAKLTGDIFEAKVQDSGDMFKNAVMEAGVILQTALIDAQIAEYESENYANDSTLTDAQRTDFENLKNAKVQILQEQKRAIATPLEKAQKEAQEAAIKRQKDLETQQTAVQEQVEAAQKAYTDAVLQHGQTSTQAEIAQKRLDLAMQKSITATDALKQSLAEMADAQLILKNLVRDYIDGLPSELANSQFAALQAKNPDDLASELIRQQAISESAGFAEEDRVKEIAGITALREKQYEISIAESATRRRELQYEEEYLKRFLELKKEGATVEELAAERRRQIEEQRTFGRGFERGLDGVQDSIDNYRSELGQEIPRLFSQNLAQGLNDAISGAKSLKEALTDAATSFFQAIAQKNIENLANIFTVGGGKAAKSIFGFASGGMIKGGSGTKDDVPAMLMGGEYVMKKSAVNKYGSSFFDALNSGKIKGFANGGGVQSGAGGFYVPGEYGTGGIRGKRELLSFATQSFTGGQYDTVGGFGMSGASVSLEPESMRLSQIGRQNNPMFERVQETKQQAFDLYLQQLKQESQYQDQLKQMEEAQKAREKQLVTSIVSAVASAVVSVGAKAFATGAENAVAQAGAEAGKPLTGLSKLGTGFMGGLKNLGALVPGGAKPAFELNDYAKAARLDIPISTYRGTIRGASIVPYRPPNFDPARRASGGMVYGGSGMRDDVPAMLTGGEFVLNNRATRKLGVQNLNRLNAGETGGEDRSGAITESLLGKLDELIQATRESSGDNVVVNVNSSESGGNNEQSMAGNEKELQRKIRQAVLDVIAQEKRLGGSLNKNN